MIALNTGWSLAAAPPGLGPQQLTGLSWQAAIVPGTVAQSLNLPHDNTQDLDASDWWYRCSFDAETAEQILHFEGLATICDVWLNDQQILQSRNMFVPYHIPVQVLPANTLLLCFRSLQATLSAKKPRPRWKTALVEQQNLRWIRSSLLGRIPGWSPKLPTIGPWRAITLQPNPALSIAPFKLHSFAEGTTGRLQFSATAHQPLLAASIHIGDQSFNLELDAHKTGLFGDYHLPDIPLWWPQPYGDPALFPCHLVLQSDTHTCSIPLGTIGFRQISMDRSDGRLQLILNGRPIFCRGACWTAADIRQLDGSPEQLKTLLTRAQQAGINMLRIGGTMAYGCDTFYQLCDQLGILVWQDFMFANMDYPLNDADFLAEVTTEVRSQLQRFQTHPCIAVYCGSSEIEQQVAMLGLPPNLGQSPFFAQTLPALCAEYQPQIPYFPSTPCEGALPFHTQTGLSHYYGVGAYRRPLSDVRQAQVRFSPECLGFSNVPTSDDLPVPHHPAWKAGVPRDNGAGWDFEDIRDFYLQQLYGVDPIALRSSDLEHYYALSRAVTGEVMLRVFAEWRRPFSNCGGALVWFLKDLRPGAGWGILDHQGQPKAVWWYLKRAWAPQAVLLTDEGLNGVVAHLHNESPQPLQGQLEIELLKGRKYTSLLTQPIHLQAFEAQSLSLDALLGHFADLNWAYRFGPPRCEAIIARLRQINGDIVHEDVLFIQSHRLTIQDAEIQAKVSIENGEIFVDLQSNLFLQTVAISCPGYQPSDNYFHLPPQQPRRLHFRPMPQAKPFKAYLQALNLENGLTIRA